MKRQQDEAYVLGTRVLGESDLIVTLLAQHHGRLSAVAPSARSSRRRFGGYLEPLSRVRAVWLEREGRELHRLESLEGLRSYAAMQSEPRHQAACAVIAEVATAFVQEGHGEPDTFRLVGAVLDALDHGADPWIVLRYFESWMLRLHGLLPDVEACSRCGEAHTAASRVVVLPGGGLECASCAARSSGPSLGLDARRLLERMRREPPSSFTQATPAERAGGALESLLRGALESYAERTFRSYRHFALAEPAPTEHRR